MSKDPKKDPCWHLKKLRNEFMSSVKSNHDKLFSALYSNKLEEVSGAMSDIVRDCMVFAELTERSRIEFVRLMKEQKDNKLN